MKRFAFFIILILVSSIGYSQYPIKTIFKGDSVIILTIEQSAKINLTIEKNSKLVKDLTRKNKEYEEELRKLSSLFAEQACAIDSLYELLRDTDKINIGQKSTLDSLWIWSLGPSLIYTEYPDDSTIYVMDLSQYYMTTDDFGIVMVKMSDREYSDYLEFIKRYGLSELALWRFRSDMRIKQLPQADQEKRRVWKFRRDFNSLEKTK